MAQKGGQEPTQAGEWVKLKGGKTGRVMETLGGGFLRISVSHGDGTETLVVKDADTDPVYPSKKASPADDVDAP